MAHDASESREHVTTSRSCGIRSKPSLVPAVSPHRPERWIRGQGNRHRCGPTGKQSAGVTGAWPRSRRPPMAPAGGEWLFESRGTGTWSFGLEEERFRELCKGVSLNQLRRLCNGPVQLSSR
jgi:hypothetical protein